MARATKTVTIEADNRDKGRSYLLTEMSAVKGEKWAFRALSAAQRGGADIPLEALSMGMAGLAVVGIQALMRAQPDEASALLDEMFECVQFVTSSGATRALIEDDIDEISTRLLLRSEVIELHTGFSLAASLSKLGQAAKAAAETSPKPSTSRRRSRQ